MSNGSLCAKLRVAAIDFLNPAPLMWDFEHPPHSDELAARYQIRYTQPSRCADDLLTGRADLGLIPIAALTPSLSIVPGCTIASLDKVRSIQLIVKVDGGRLDQSRRMEHPGTELIHEVLRGVKTVQTDTASRSSVAYAQILLRKFAGSSAEFSSAPADPRAMLSSGDAALLIGDHALLALENRAEIEEVAGPCLWLDIAQEWRRRTGLPWVAAVWAVRRESLDDTAVTARQLIEDLQLSRDNGIAHVEQLVKEWSPRIAVAPETIREYLTANIHYVLTDECVEAIKLFRSLAAEAGALPPLDQLRFLD